MSKMRIYGFVGGVLMPIGLSRMIAGNHVLLGLTFFIVGCISIYLSFNQKQFPQAMKEYRAKHGGRTVKWPLMIVGLLMELVGVAWMYSGRTPFWPGAILGFSAVGLVRLAVPLPPVLLRKEQVALVASTLVGCAFLAGGIGLLGFERLRLVTVIMIAIGAVLFAVSIGIAGRVEAKAANR